MQQPIPIQAIQLVGAERTHHTASLFGTAFPLLLEPCVYATATDLSSLYDGGYWLMYRLSNGAFYMHPESSGCFPVVAENGYAGSLSPQAFGITCCLYAYSRLSFLQQYDIAQVFSQHYHMLRDYMLEHPEAQQILRAID